MDFHGEPIQNPIYDKPLIKENVDKIRDILNDFIEPDDGGNGGIEGDGVDEGATGSNQYFVDLFTEIETELYPRCTTRKNVFYGDIFSGDINIAANN